MWRCDECHLLQTLCKVWVSFLLKRCKLRVLGAVDLQDITSLVHVGFLYGFSFLTRLYAGLSWGLCRENTSGLYCSGS